MLKLGCLLHCLFSVIERQRYEEASSSPVVARIFLVDSLRDLLVSFGR